MRIAQTASTVRGRIDSLTVNFHPKCYDNAPFMSSHASKGPAPTAVLSHLSSLPYINTPGRGVLSDGFRLDNKSLACHSEGPCFDLAPYRGCRYIIGYSGRDSYSNQWMAIRKKRK